MLGKGGGKPPFSEAHFCSLPSQSNIYGLSALSASPEKTELLVSCLGGEVQQLEQPGSAGGGLVSRRLQLPFASTPIEVLAIDAYRGRSLVPGGGTDGPLLLAVVTSRLARSAVPSAAPAATAAAATPHASGLAIATPAAAASIGSVTLSSSAAAAAAMVAPSPVASVAAAAAAAVSTAAAAAASAGRELAQYALSIYQAATWEQSGTAPTDFAAVGDDFELSFAPCHLTHTTPPPLTATCRVGLVADRLSGVGNAAASARCHDDHPIFLLGGSDCRVHLYGKVTAQSSSTWASGSTDSFRCVSGSEAAEAFPEFERPFDEEPLWIDVCYTRDSCQRLTAVGCRRAVTFSITSTTLSGSCAIIARLQSDCMMGPITSVRFFAGFSTHFRPPDFLRDAALSLDSACDASSCTSLWRNSSANADRDDGCDCRAIASSSPSSDLLHLLVTSAFTPSVVFRDVLTSRLTQLVSLPGSERYDCVLGSCIDDVDFDGRNEILLATYGRKLLAYKLDDTFIGCRPDARAGESVTAPAAVAAGSGVALPLWVLDLPYPALGVRSIDIDGDAVRELLVLSSRGIHVLKHDMDDIVSLCKSRLRKIAAALG